MRYFFFSILVAWGQNHRFHIEDVHSPQLSMTIDKKDVERQTPFDTNSNLAALNSTVSENCAAD